MNRLPYSLQCYLDEISENYAHLTQEQIIDIIKSEEDNYSMPLFYLLFGRNFGLFTDAFTRYQVKEDDCTMLLTDIYMKVYDNKAKAIKEYDASSAKFSTYLYRIIQSKVIDFLRSQKSYSRNIELFSNIVIELPNQDDSNNLKTMLELIDTHCKDIKASYILNKILCGYSTDEILKLASSDENSPFEGCLSRDNFYQIKSRAIGNIKRSYQNSLNSARPSYPSFNRPFTSFMIIRTPEERMGYGTDTLFDNPISVGQTNNIFIKNLIGLYNEFVLS